MDNLGGGKDHPHIDVSNVVLCYCSEKWFSSAPCIREVVRAVLRKRPLIALLQPATSVQHGGLTEADCRAILRGEKMLNGEGGRLTYSQRLQDQQLEVMKWSDAWAEPVELPTVKEIEEALFASAPIVWSPLADFQDVTLRLIAERLLPGHEHAYGTPYRQLAYKQGEIELRLHDFKLSSKGSETPSSRWRLSSGRRSLDAERGSNLGSSADSNRPYRRFHLFVGAHSPRARDVALEIAAMLNETGLPPLLWTEDARELEHCEHMLVHLSSETWTRGPESRLFAQEVCAAMRAGVHRLLAHEVPGARLDDAWRCGCSFEEVMDATPEYLLRAGIYHEIAMNLAGGEWRRAGLVGLVREISKSGGTRARWKVEPREPPAVAPCSNDSSREEAMASASEDSIAREAPPSLRGSRRSSACKGTERGVEAEIRAALHALPLPARLPAAAESIRRARAGAGDPVPPPPSSPRGCTAHAPTSTAHRQLQAVDVTRQVTKTRRANSLPELGNQHIASRGLCAPPCVSNCSRLCLNSCAALNPTALRL